MKAVFLSNKARHLLNLVIPLGPSGRGSPVCVLLGESLIHPSGATIRRKHISKDGCPWKRDLWFIQPWIFNVLQTVGPGLLPAKLKRKKRVVLWAKLFEGVRMGLGNEAPYLVSQSQWDLQQQLSQWWVKQSSGNQPTWVWKSTHMPWIASPYSKWIRGV